MCLVKTSLVPPCVRAEDDFGRCCAIDGCRSRLGGFVDSYALLDEGVEADMLLLLGRIAVVRVEVVRRARLMLRRMVGGRDTRRGVFAECAIRPFRDVRIGLRVHERGALRAIVLLLGFGDGVQVTVMPCAQLALTLVLAFGGTKEGAGGKFARQKLRDTAVLQNRFMPNIWRGEVEAVMSGSSGSVVDRCRIWLGLWRGRPLDGRVKRTIEPCDIRVLEPSSERRRWSALKAPGGRRTRTS